MLRKKTFSYVYVSKKKDIKFKTVHIQIFPIAPGMFFITIVIPDPCFNPGFTLHLCL